MFWGMLMAAGRSLRFDVFNRDSFTCVYCGRTPPIVTLEVDHIDPVSNGGRDEEENLVTSCFDCNRGKRDKTGVEPRPTPLTSERIAQEQERIEQLKAYNEYKIFERKELERYAMMVSDRWMEREGEEPNKFMMGEERMSSVRRFIEQLPVTDVFDAVDIAFNKHPYGNSNTWKYFCGVCWRKIKIIRGEVFP